MIHPATSIDLEAASSRFHSSLLGGDYWDELAVAMKPELKQVGDEHLDYTFDACIDHDLAEDGVDPRSPEGIAALRRWTDFRAKTCAEILAQLPVVDGCVRGHRLIACAPEELRPSLGLFWTHNLDDWPDPYAPWSEKGRNAPTLVIEAQIPVDAIDWQASCMALMDWYSGDAESELRVFPEHAVVVTSCRSLEDDRLIELPDIAYTS